LGFADDGESGEAPFGILCDGVVKKLDGFSRVAEGEIHVADGKGEIFGDGIAFIGGGEGLVIFHGAVGGVLEGIRHRCEILRANLRIVGGEERAHMADEDTGFVVFLGVEKDFAHFENGGGDLIGLGADFPEFLEFAFVVLVELLFEGGVIGTKGGSFESGEAFNFVLLKCDHFVLRDDGAVGF